MHRPEVFYAIALGLALLTEAGFAARGREAFGPLVWVLGANFALAYAALFAGLHLPSAQMVLHAAFTVIGLSVARGMVGHLCASLFIPMAGVGVLHHVGLVGDVTWWWSLFYLACAQLIFLGMGSNLHPLGRAIRTWSSSVHQYFSRVAGAS